MAASTRMDAPEAEQFKWYEKTVSESESEFDYDLSSAENKNTKRKTETDMRIFSSFLLTMNEMRTAETVEPVELDRYLTTFFSVIKKHDGNEYEPASLRGMLCSIERYLRARNYPKSLTRDIVFLSTRNTLKDRQMVLRELAKTTKKGKQELLTSSSIEKLKQLYNAKEFGPYSPMAVINSLCFAFVVHLKIRKAIDHKQLLWGDIAVKKQDSREYLCYEPVQDKDYFRQRLSNISHYRIYSQSEPGSPADPVAVYKLYATKRPAQALSPDSPFYLGLAVNNQALDQQPQWFKTTAMGVNKLNDLVRMIREITGSLAVSVSSSVGSLLENYNATYREPVGGAEVLHDAAVTINRNTGFLTTDPRQQSNATYPVNDVNDSPSAPESLENESRMRNVSDQAAPDNDGTTQFGNKIDADNNGKPSQPTTIRPTQTSADADQDSGCASFRENTRRHQQVKQNITDILEDLDHPDRLEILSWLAKSYFREGIPCKRCDKPRKFSINFVWTDTETDLKANVTSTPLENEPPSSHSSCRPNIEITRATLKDTNGQRTPISNILNDKEFEQRTSNQPVNETVDIENTTLISDVENRHTPLPRLLAYKRSASSSPDREQKSPRIQQLPEDPANHSVTNPTESDKDRQCKHSDIIVNTDVQNAPETNGSQSLVGSPNGNVQPWYAPWAFDPRLTMYLRQGLVPMYVDCSKYDGSVKHIKP